MKRCIVIKTTTLTTTEVYQVDVPKGNGYPTQTDLAISATLHARAIGIDESREVKFQAMEAK